MENRKEIFDLTDLHDIPKEVQESLTPVRRPSPEERILGLLKMAGRPITMDEMIVGYYRLHNKGKTKNQLYPPLLRLCTANPSYIERTGERGSFRYALTPSEASLEGEKGDE